MPLLPQRREFPRALSPHGVLATLRTPEGTTPLAPLLPHRPKASGLHTMLQGNRKCGQVVGQSIPLTGDIGGSLSITIVRRITNCRQDLHSHEAVDVISSDLEERGTPPTLHEQGRRPFSFSSFLGALSVPPRSPPPCSSFASTSP